MKMHRKTLICAAAASFAIGCGSPATTVFVEVCGDVLIPQDLDALRISVLKSDREEYQSGTRDLLLCPENETLSLPQTTELETVVGLSWVTVQGLKDGVEVARFERRLRIEEDDDAAEVILGLTRSCMRVQCSLGQTCVDGTCVVADFESTDAICTGGPPSEGAGTDVATVCPDTSGPLGGAQ